MGRKTATDTNFDYGHVQESDFLRSQEGRMIKPCNKKIDAVLLMSPPENVSQLRSSPGAVTYDRNFWPRCYRKCRMPFLCRRAMTALFCLQPSLLSRFRDALFFLWMELLNNGVTSFLRGRMMEGFRRSEYGVSCKAQNKKRKHGLNYGKKRGWNLLVMGIESIQRSTWASEGFSEGRIIQINLYTWCKDQQKRSTKH